MWRVESYPNVHHLVSEVVGGMRPDCDSCDALEALFPGGSITGCPKTATIAAIDALERSALPPTLATASSLYNPASGLKKISLSIFVPQGCPAGLDGVTGFH